MEEGNGEEVRDNRERVGVGGGQHQAERRIERAEDGRKVKKKAAAVFLCEVNINSLQLDSPWKLLRIGTILLVCVFIEILVC